MMTSELQNLAKIGSIRAEKFSQTDFDGLVESAQSRLTDAKKKSLADASRFDLAYNASHALALAALRSKGFRSNNRYVVFQALAQTVGLPAKKSRIFATAHDLRNHAEYEGTLDVDDQFLADLLTATDELLTLVKGLSAPK